MLNHMIAPFSGHLYRIEDAAERLNFISHVYESNLLDPDPAIGRDGNQEYGDRIADLGGGWVLTTLSPEWIKIAFPHFSYITEQARAA